jgi:glycosyltransferase involved in cell wall biosynthesis
LPGLDLHGFEIDLVGDGPSLPMLRQMAAELDLPVRFWGWLDNASPELKDLYERSSIFVFTSEAENFPVVLLEAMAAGQAIVTCDGTGCPEVVGQDALLVPPRRPDQIRAALARLIEDEALRMDLAARARVRVEREFGWNVIATRYAEIYGAVSAQPARGERLAARHQARVGHGHAEVRDASEGRARYGRPAAAWLRRRLAEQFGAPPHR